MRLYAWFFRYSFIFLSSSACAILQYMIKTANASLINLIIWLNIFLKIFLYSTFYRVFSGIDILTTTKMWLVYAKMGRVVGMSKIYTGRSKVKKYDVLKKTIIPHLIRQKI